METPKTITVARLEVVVMPNGEILCAGKTVGWMHTLGKYVTRKDGARKEEKANG